MTHHPVHEPCEKCDFIGPMPENDQPPLDLHRAWHDLARTWQAGVQPMLDAWRSITRAARESTKANYTLIPHLEEDTMPTWKTPENIEPGDTVELHRGAATARDVVERVDGDNVAGWSLILRETTHVYHTATGWTVTDVVPLMPDLVDDARYYVTFQDGNTARVTWAPIDGIRANHPWLGDDEAQTRYREDWVIRARPIDAETNPSA